MPGPLFSYQSLSPESLQGSNIWNVHPFLHSLHDTALEQSIQNTDLLVAPLVKKIENGSYQVVDGLRRLRIYFRIHGDIPVVCRLIRHDISTQQLIALIFEEAQRDRPLTAIEVAYFYRLCIEHMPSEWTIEFLRSNTKIDLGKRPEQFLRQLLALTPPAQLHLHTGFIALSVAFELAGLPEQDQLFFIRLFENLHFGNNKQRRLLSLLKDLSRRAHMSMLDYFDFSQCSRILDTAEMNPPQKGHAVLQHLQELSMPAFTEEKSNFERWKSKIQLPPSCDITASQYFEKDTVLLTVSFANRQELENCWPQVAATLPAK